MAGFSIVMMMGAFSVFFFFLMGVLLVCLLGGLFIGLVVLSAGIRLKNNPGALAKAPRLPGACFTLGLAAAVVNGLAFAASILLFVISFQGVDATAGVLLPEIYTGLVILGFLLFQAMGVLLLQLFRLSKSENPPLMGRAVTYVCLLLGILTLLVGLAILIGVLLLIFLFSLV